MESNDQRESLILAPYAMFSANSAGRKYPEPTHTYRGPYQRDRDRIIHSAAFRRLSYKTQVFTGELGDYHRTRLTHTLEVASIARTLARALRVNEDLVETLALAHDIGHPPFGHSGEDVLDECLRDEGGFNHNAQALRIVERLEVRYPDFPGLNLSHEVLEGQAYRKTKSDTERMSPLLEVQIVDAADSIAYDAHDADDALELGLLELNDLLELPLWQEAANRVRKKYGDLEDNQLRRAVVREVIDWQVGDLLRVTQQQLRDQKITGLEMVRRVPPLAGHSAEIAQQKQRLEKFLYERVYRHPNVLANRSTAQKLLHEMFIRLCDSPDSMPAKFQELASTDGLPRAVVDYLSGMTDRFAVDEHRRLFGESDSGARTAPSPW
jgi:dGTPase